VAVAPVNSAPSKLVVDREEVSGGGMGWDGVGWGGGVGAGKVRGGGSVGEEKRGGEVRGGGPNLCSPKKLPFCSCARCMTLPSSSDGVYVYRLDQNAERWQIDDRVSE
jgi:hypothetical protein